MARVPKSEADAKALKAKTALVLKGRENLGALSRKRTKKTKCARGVSKLKAEQYVLQIDELIESGLNGEELTPTLFVALFCWMHDAIYDVECVDEVAPEWNVAASRLSLMIEEDFEGDKAEFLTYLQWAAKDEERVELWRRSNRQQGKRIKWRDWFMLKSKLSDYRLFKIRTQGVD
ncbi:MAG: hypothetical protein WC565_01910 [Parcubacteria group bacterium]